MHQVYQLMGVGYLNKTPNHLVATMVLVSSAAMTTHDVLRTLMTYQQLGTNLFQGHVERIVRHVILITRTTHTVQHISNRHCKYQKVSSFCNNVSCDASQSAAATAACMVITCCVDNGTYIQ